MKTPFIPVPVIFHYVMWHFKNKNVDRKRTKNVEWPSKVSFYTSYSNFLFPINFKNNFTLLFGLKCAADAPTPIIFLGSFGCHLTVTVN